MTPPNKPLSPREVDIVAALGAGMSYAETGRKLGMSKLTVRKAAQMIVIKLPRECRSEGGPIATIRNWVNMVETHA